MTNTQRATHLKQLLGAVNPASIRFSLAQHIVIAEIRTHFHETGETPDTDDYDADECITSDIAAIEEILRATR
jgi:hypothetical protein